MSFSCSSLSCKVTVFWGSINRGTIILFWSVSVSTTSASLCFLMNESILADMLTLEEKIYYRCSPIRIFTAYSTFSRGYEEYSRTLEEGQSGLVLSIGEDEEPIQYKHKIEKIYLNNKKWTRRKIWRSRLQRDMKCKLQPLVLLFISESWKSWY